MPKKSVTLLSFIVSFLKNEYVIDAVRNTIAVILPLYVFFNLGWPSLAIGMGVGALMACITDLPGNRNDKYKAVWLTVVAMSLVAWVTAWSIHFPVFMIVFVVALTFISTMLGVFGQRYGAIGLMLIVLATFTIGLKPQAPFYYALYIGLGGIWYSIISVLQIFIFPYRSLSRAIQKTIKLTAAQLSLRAEGYNPNINLAGFNQRNIDLQLRISTQHELIRQLLLTDTKALNENKKGQKLLHIGIHLMDLYEQASAVHSDYPYLRMQFKEIGALPSIERLVSALAAQLKNIDAEIINSDAYRDHKTNLVQLAKALDTDRASLLQQIIANILEIEQLVLAIKHPSLNESVKDKAHLADFISVVPVKLATVKAHLTLSSPMFRFALRLTALCLVAMVAIAILREEMYSYWLLLTLLIVSRPYFSHTVQRNYERFFGTLAGLILGWLAIQFLSFQWQLMASVFALFTFFVFNRPKYGISVVGITIAVIIALNAYQGNLWVLLSDRAYFTLSGVILCLLASFLFPIWNTKRLNGLILAAVDANLKYFNTAIACGEGSFKALHENRLARKFSHQSLFALSEGITAAHFEPFKQKVNWSCLQRIQLHLYQINALIATFSNLKKINQSNLSAASISEINENLQLSIQEISNYQLNNAVPTFKHDGKPMELLATSKTLLKILQEAAK